MVIYKMIEAAILSVISVLVSGCSSENIKSSLKIKNKKVGVKDIDNNDVKNIEEIKKRFKLKDVKDLIFIPIKKNRCIVWNNYYYRHAVFSDSPRLMLGPINESIQEVGGGERITVWRARLQEKGNLIPIRYGKNHDVCFHHDSNPKTKKINELSMLVYLEDVDEGYFILEKSKECGEVYVDRELNGTELAGPRGDEMAKMELRLAPPREERRHNGRDRSGEKLPFQVELDQRFVDPDTEYVECGGKIINLKKKNYCITKLELGSDFNKNIKKIKKSFDDETKWSEDRLAATHLPSLGKIEEISPNNKEECNNSLMESGRIIEDDAGGWLKNSIDPDGDGWEEKIGVGAPMSPELKVTRELLMIGNEPLKNIGKWSKRPNNNFVYLYEDEDNKITKKLKGKLDNCDITFI